tara:strand:+ start:609 stop:2165 length:1557 start_codon:yes stop_codon:yes gene_type:complete
MSNNFNILNQLEDNLDQKFMNENMGLNLNNLSIDNKPKLPGEYIPKDKRKKILLITDDIRVQSGVAQIGREIVLATSHHFNWTAIGGAMKHPEMGKVIDMSEETNKILKMDDSDIKLYPSNGYGDPLFLKFVIAREKPDAILLITDPRYFVWLFQMENEIRNKIPIAYLNIWDDFPAPQYNEEYYESCDLLMGISKQTKFINEIVLGDKAKNKLIKYLPHGLNSNYFYSLPEIDPILIRFKQNIFQGKIPKFSLLFNSRNIRRKQIPDTILAWRLFTEQLSPKERDNVRLILHTEDVSDHGTDLHAVIDYFSEGEDGYQYSDIKLDPSRLSTEQMNYLYNSVDGVILLSSAEGWGLALTEALLSGTPIIANVTGGMQDQMRFIDNEGNWFTPSSDVPSNHRGTYKTCGKWAFPVFPKTRSIQGSPPTPYIYDDRCCPEEAAEQIMNLYKMSHKERKEIGNEGSNWARSEEAGFTHFHQGQRIVDNFDELFSTWKPREKYEFLKDTDYKKRVLKHKLTY